MTTSFKVQPDAMARLACAAAIAFLVFAGIRTMVGEWRSSHASPPAGTIGKPAPDVTPRPPPAIERPAAGTWLAPSNLFASTHVSNYLARVAAEKAAAVEADRKAALKAADLRKAADASKEKAEATPPKPAFVTFTYRGMMRRTDATELALIAAVPGGGTNFYRAGELCRGLTVTNILDREVGLIVSNGVPETLKAGQSLKLPEELCHERP